MRPTTNKRKHARIEATNLISQESMDSDGCCLSQGLGRALDVSLAGLKLETPYPVDGYLVSLAILDLDEQLVEIIGEPLYCRKVASGVYHTGIKFVGSETEIKSFAVSLVKLHNHRKHETYVEVAA